MDNNRYTIISEFVCCGKDMVVVKLEHGTHVMPVDEWKQIYGWMHPERWGNSKRVRKKKIA